MYDVVLMTTKTEANVYSVVQGRFRHINQTLDYRAGTTEEERTFDLAETRLGETSQGLAGRVYLADGPNATAYAAGDDIEVIIDGKPAPSQRGTLKEGQVLEAKKPNSVGMVKATYQKPG